MTTHALTKSSPYLKTRIEFADLRQRRLDQAPSKVGFELNTALLIISLIVFTALITVMTLFFAGKQVTKGYVVKQLEAQRQTLARENDVIGARLAQAQAAGQLMLSKKTASMVQLTDSRITFIRGENNLAQR